MRKQQQVAWLIVAVGGLALIFLGLGWERRKISQPAPDPTPRGSMWRRAEKPATLRDLAITSEVDGDRQGASLERKKSRAPGYRGFF